MSASPMNRKAKTLQDTALSYHDEGWFVIPLRHGTKMPLIKWNRNAKRPSRKSLAKFWERDGDPPDLALRLDDKHLVIDLDPQNDESVTELYEDLKGETQCSTTPNGGLHAWYRVARPIRPRSYKGMDVLTKGRMAVIPPSEGREWVGKPQPHPVSNPGGMIDKLVEAVGIESIAAGEGLAKDFLGALDQIPVHRRNHTLTAIAGVLRSAGFRGNRLEAAIQGLADHIVEQPAGDEVTAEDVARICSSIDWRRPDPFDTTEATRYEFNTKDEPPPLRWLVEDFLPGEGVTALFGMGKQGKSYVAMELLRCLSLPAPFLGLKTPDKPSRVLYVDWEKRGASLRRRLHALAKGDALNVTVMEPHGALVSMVERLHAEVTLGDYDLVIIDSLTIAIMQGDVTEAATVVPAMFALNALGCPVLALDHTRKPVFGEPYESLSAFGSVFKGNVCSMNWRLKKVSGDESRMNIVMQHVNNNYDVDPPDMHAHIGFEFDTHGILSGAEITRNDLGPAQSAIWDHLDLQTAPISVEQIAKDLNMQPTPVRQKLEILKEGLFVHRYEDDTWAALHSPEGELDD